MEEDVEIELFKLKNGLHTITYNLTDVFFEQFESSSLQKGSLQVVVNLEKLDNTIKTILHLQGKIAVTCDICLEDIYKEVKNELKLMVKITDAPTEDVDNEEVVYVSSRDGKLDLKQHIYDMVYLALPIKKTCDDPGNTPFCNIQVVKRLNSLNEEKPSGDETDPRWDKLKNLLK